MNLSVSDLILAIAGLLTAVAGLVTALNAHARIKQLIRERGKDAAGKTSDPSG